MSSHQAIALPERVSSTHWCDLADLAFAKGQEVGFSVFFLVRGGFLRISWIFLGITLAFFLGFFLANPRLGCIPVLFEHQELDMFEAFASAEEFANAVVYIPEAEIMGPGRLSIWGTGTFHQSSHKWKQLQQLYPRYAEVFEALRPKQSREEREEQLRRLFPKATSISQILGSFSQEEIHRKQEAMAKISHRFVIALDDSTEDAWQLLLKRIMADDHLAKRRNAKSTLSS